MYSTRWYVGIFIPAIHEAHSKGVNVRALDRFTEWVRKSDERQWKFGEVLVFARELGSTWEDAVDEALMLEV